VSYQVLLGDCIASMALKHGRKAILCELNPKYAAMIGDRVASIAGPSPVAQPVGVDPILWALLA